jgi:hypothetical protein
MDEFLIEDPASQAFPFGRELFQDPQILYHGTWSTYCPGIESGCFSRCELPFEEEHFITVAQARKAIGRGSWWKHRFSSDNMGPGRELCMTGHFWLARSYATDGGGEVAAPFPHRRQSSSI